MARDSRSSCHAPATRSTNTGGQHIRPRSRKRCFLPDTTLMVSRIPYGATGQPNPE